MPGIVSLSVPVAESLSTWSRSWPLTSRRIPRLFTIRRLFTFGHWGVAPYTYDKFKYNFRHNSFFIGHNTRDAVNRGGDADYTPIFLSDVPELFRRGLVTVDVALIQTSPPDDHGYMSLGVSADTVKAALEKHHWLSRR